MIYEIKKHLIQEGISEHLKNNWGKYALGAGAGVLATEGGRDAIQRAGMAINPFRTNGDRIVADYQDGAISDFGSSISGNALTGGLSMPVSGMYQGFRTGHPVVGAFFGKAGTLGAASNDNPDITVGDSYTTANVVGNLGIGAPVTAIQYGAGKLFGAGKSDDYYSDRLAQMDN